MILEPYISINKSCKNCEKAMNVDQAYDYARRPFLLVYGVGNIVL